MLQELKKKIKSVFAVFGSRSKTPCCFNMVKAWQYLLISFWIVLIIGSIAHYAIYRSLINAEVEEGAGAGREVFDEEAFQEVVTEYARKIENLEDLLIEGPSHIDP